jgi:hypothetical protein
MEGEKVLACHILLPIYQYYFLGKRHGTVVIRALRD